MLHHINIRNFRNFEHFETEFGQGITALIGKNGSGKSSLIEAINFLSVGRSFRARHDRDTINKQIIGTGDFTSIKARVSIDEDLNEIQNSIKQEISLVIIAHRKNTISICDTIYTVEDGKVYKEQK